MKLESASGDIELSDLTLSGGLSIDTSSGDVSLRETSLGKTEIHASSGALSLKKSTIAALALTTTSGNMTIEDIVASEETELRTVSGSIKLVSFETEKPLRLTSTSGAIRISGSKLANANIHASSGDVRISELQRSHYFSCRSTSGDIEMSSPDYEEKDITEEMRNTLIDITTVSGNISIQ